jgi:hypothetical protein
VGIDFTFSPKCLIVASSLNVPDGPRNEIANFFSNALQFEIIAL